jgi:hypothetical protein
MGQSLGHGGSYPARHGPPCLHLDGGKPHHRSSVPDVALCTFQHTLNLIDVCMCGLSDNIMSFIVLGSVAGCTEGRELCGTVTIDWNAIRRKQIAKRHQRRRSCFPSMGILSAPVLAIEWTRLIPCGSLQTLRLSLHGNAPEFGLPIGVPVGIKRVGQQHTRL